MNTSTHSITALLNDINAAEAAAAAADQIGVIVQTEPTPVAEVKPAKKVRAPKEAKAPKVKAEKPAKPAKVAKPKAEKKAKAPAKAPAPAKPQPKQKERLALSAKQEQMFAALNALPVTPETHANGNFRVSVLGQFDKRIWRRLFTSGANSYLAYADKKETTFKMI